LLVINYHLNQIINLKKLIAFINQPSNKFISFFILSLVIWFSFYHYLYIIDSVFGDSYDSLLKFSEILAKQSNSLLSVLGFDPILEIHGDMVVTKLANFPYSHGVWIGEPCNGVKIFGVFSIFIICFRGKVFNKIWFIVLGIITLHLLNIIRIASLSYIAAIQPRWLNFNHNITFQILVYGTMGILWLIWIKKFSNMNKTEKSY
jgi:exosortase family protein XrtF